MGWNKSSFGKEWCTKNKDATQDMHHTQYFLYRKKTVGNHTEKKRRNDGTGGACHIGEVDHIRHTMALHVISTGGIPGAPDKELQKHHDAEAGLWRIEAWVVKGLNELCHHGLLNQLFHVLKRNTRGMIDFFDSGQLMIFISPANNILK